MEKGRVPPRNKAEARLQTLIEEIATLMSREGPCGGAEMRRRHGAATPGVDVRVGSHALSCQSPAHPTHPQQAGVKDA